MKKGSILLLFIGILYPLSDLVAGVRNIREQCRKSVSGALIEMYNERDRAKNFSTYLGAQLRELELARGSLVKALSISETLVRDNEFKVEYQESMEGFKYKLNLIEGEIKSAKSQLAKAKGESISFTKEIKAFEREISVVFNKKLIEVTDATGYPWILDYHHSCGKYRYVCPLPLKQRQHLVRLKIRMLDNVKGEVISAWRVPISCRRYSQILPPQN